MSLCLIEMVSLLHHLVRGERKKESLIGLLEFVLIVMVLFMFVIMGITEYKCFRIIIYLYMLIYFLNFEVEDIFKSTIMYTLT